LVVVATYNESQTVGSLVEWIMAMVAGVDLLVVDDNSPDGTGKFAMSFARGEMRTHVLLREKKEGLASALVAGFEWGLGRGYEWVANLDGDLSHDPNAIPALLHGLEGADMAIGSRYWGGVRIIGWSPGRMFLSLAAARYVRLVTGMPFADPTSGFRCFRREALQAALAEPILSRGYSFHVECLHRIWRLGGRIVEVPIVFRDRAAGESKMTFGIVCEAAWMMWRLLWQNHLRRRPRRGNPPWAATGQGGASATSQAARVVRRRAARDVLSPASWEAERP
jgi:dolichol-phosphate mannosyltransferase